MGPEKEASTEIEYLSTSGVYKTPFTLIIIVQLFIGGILLILVNIWYWNYFYYYLTGELLYDDPNFIKEVWFELLIWFLLPLNIYGNLFLFSFSIILFSAGIYRILIKMQPIREGIFERGSKDWKYMHRRFWTAYLVIWLARALPLPWVDIVCYRLFGVKIGRNVVAYEGYIDAELVEIDDFTMTSLNIQIHSHLIYHDKVLIKRVKIGKACVIGPQTIIAPGTIMHDEAILGANSYTWIGQELEGNLIHVGTPVSMTFPIQTLEQSKEKAERIKKSTIADSPSLTRNENEGGKK